MKYYGARKYYGAPCWTGPNNSSLLPTSERKCAYLCGPHLEPCNRRRGHGGFCYHLDVAKDSEIPCIAAVAKEQAEGEILHDH